MIFTLLYPNFRPRAIAFSYDDGVRGDKGVIEVLNRYGLKGTFNLNSGLSGSTKIRNGIDCSHLDLSLSKGLYQGHEVATHTFTHPHLESISYDENRKEYEEDINILSSIFGTEIHGSAYPYGTYSEDTIKALRDLGISYGRTTRSTHSFSLPANFLLWHPTCHHNDPLLFPLLKEFYSSDIELPLFFLWGHSYEFDINHNLDILDEFCKDISTHDDVYNGTDYELFSYIDSANMVYFRDGAFVNPSSKEVFLRCNGSLINVAPHSKKEFLEGKA